MKNYRNKTSTNFFKKIFIKLSRILGFEIVDQSRFYVPTREKSLDGNLNIAGKKSITIPLGEVKISRKVKELTVIFRSCASINMLSQNKERLFGATKAEYTLRSLNSIIKCIKYAQKYFINTSFKLIVIDYNSKQEIIEKIQMKLTESNIESRLLNLDLKDYRNKINEVNALNEKVTENQISNMSNIYKSLQIAKNECKDLIYFVEDDYIHQTEAIQEMLFTYERISSLINKELILCPTDYPYLYNKIENTIIFLGASRHWRKINETLVSFLTSKKIVETYWKNLLNMCTFEHYPFESPLHDIYKQEYCLSPIPSLAMHCTNINSVYGISPFFKWKKFWDDNENKEK